MKRILNHVQVIGRLGAAPEVKEMQNGGRLARFSVAVSSSYVTKTGRRSQMFNGTRFLRGGCWRMWRKGFFRKVLNSPLTVVSQIVPIRIAMAIK